MNVTRRLELVVNVTTSGLRSTTILSSRDIAASLPVNHYHWLEEQNRYNDTCILHDLTWIHVHVHSIDM
jgi:hypothetical protein